MFDPDFDLDAESQLESAARHLPMVSAHFTPVVACLLVVPRSVNCNYEREHLKCNVVMYQFLYPAS